MAVKLRPIPYGFAEDAMLSHPILYKKYHCSGRQIARWRKELGLPTTRLGKPVDQFTMDGQFIKRYVSLHHAAREIKGHYENISACAAGKFQSAYGFQWRYADGN